MRIIKKNPFSRFIFWMYSFTLANLKEKRVREWREEEEWEEEEEKEKEDEDEEEEWEGGVEGRNDENGTIEKSEYRVASSQLKIIIY